MSRYEDEDTPRGRGVKHYTYSGGVASPPAYSHKPTSRRTTYNGKSQALLTYDPEKPYYPPGSASGRRYSTESHSRTGSPTAVTDPSRDERRRRRRRRRDEDDKYSDSDSNSAYLNSGDDNDDRVKSPVEMAKRFVDNTFTDSPTGLGVSVLGALVGGLAAREAVDFASKRNDHGGDDAEHRRNQLIGTVVGAAVGALGANAVEKRIENRRARDEIKQERWERKWVRPDDGVEPDTLDRLAIMPPPRSSDYSRDSRHREDSRRRGGSRRRDRGSDDDDRDVYEYRYGYGDSESGDESRRRTRTYRRGEEREVDPPARSWKNVEDWRRSVTP